MTDLAKLRYVTEHYAQLQGLRLVPLGILFLAVAAWQNGMLRWLPASQEGGADPWFGGGLVVAVLAAYAIGGYYRREFGTVEPRRFRTGGPSLLANAAIVAALLVLQDVFRWPVSLAFIYIGTVLAYTGLVQRGLRKHYVGIAVAFLVLANLHSFGVPPHTAKTLLSLLVGGSLIVAGVGDHLVLRKVLQPPSRQAYVNTPV